MIFVLLSQSRFSLDKFNRVKRSLNGKELQTPLSKDTLC